MTNHAHILLRSQLAGIGKGIVKSKEINQENESGSAEGQ
jgi:hypothetical protein